MSTPLSLTPEAEADILDAHAWYESQTKGRGDEFVAELAQRLNDICVMPHSFGFVKGKVRAAILIKSQFVVYYRVESIGVVVIAVQHARAHPGRWRRRS